MQKLPSFKYMHLALLSLNLFILYIISTNVPHALPLLLAFNIVSIFIALIIIYNLAQKLRLVSLIDIYTALLCSVLFLLFMKLVVWSTSRFALVIERTPGFHVTFLLCTLLFDIYFIYVCFLLGGILNDFVKGKKNVVISALIFITLLLVSVGTVMMLYHASPHLLKPLRSFLLFVKPYVHFGASIAFISHTFKLLKHKKTTNRSGGYKYSEVTLFIITYLTLTVMLRKASFESINSICLFYLLLSLIVPIIFNHIYAQEIPAIISRLDIQEQSNLLLKHYLHSLESSKASVQKDYTTLDHLYDQLLCCYPDSLIIVQNNTITYANHHLLQLLSLPETYTMVTTDLKQYLSADSYGKLQPILDSLVAPGDASGYIPLELVSFTGNTIGVEAFFVRSRDAVADSYMISIRVLSSKERERQLAEKIHREQLKVELFSAFSHDLKTPINIIYSAAQLQESLITAGDLTKIALYNNMISGNCLRLLKLLNNLLDINRIESNYFTPTFQPIELVSFTENVVDSIQPYAKRKHLHTLFDTTHEEIVISADPDLIERILLNLLSNAIKYTPDEGHIEVLMRTDNAHVYISIADTGIGICNKRLSAIFDPFVRVDDDAFVNKTEGTGIGLSLVRSLVTLNHGTINVESVLHQGSTFTLSFPILEDIDASILEYTFTDGCSRLNMEFSNVFEP